MTVRQLFAQGSVVLDASGNGAVTLRPTGEEWAVTLLTVNTASRNVEASARVYKNYVGDAYLVDSTISASTGDTSDTNHTLTDGESLIVEWSGGDPGTTAYAVVRGQATNFSSGGFRALS